MSEGQPKKKRTGLIILLVILGVLFVLIAGCALLVGVVFKAAGDAVDPANNAKTGLVDGSYTIQSNTSAIINDSCSFSGPAFDMDSNKVSDDVSVVGSGLDCGLGSETKFVEFTVSGGVADITSVQ
jgi:hypothetical protein